MIFDVIMRAAEQVKLFSSDIVGLKVPEKPELLSPDRFDFRWGHLMEEMTEMRTAQTNGAIDEVADGLIDNIYISLGMLCEMGIAFQPAFEEVHNANMRKKRGELSKRPGANGFDAVKPIDWTGPDYSFLLSIDKNDIETLKALKSGEASLILKTGATVTTKEKKKKKNIIVIGYGGHGKDTVCEILRDKYGYKFTSSSRFCADIVFPEWNDMFKSANARTMGHFDPATGKYFTLNKYSNAEECFNDRHRTEYHRKAWFDIISEYNMNDKARLAKEIFAENNIYCGLRNIKELNAIQSENLVDLIIWVDAGDRVKPESVESCTVNMFCANYIIDNHGTLEQLQIEVDKLVNEAEL